MEIIGHQKQQEFLKKMIESGNPSHAILFAGQAHLGKKALALEWALSILKKNPSTHPDFIYLAPLDSQIKIEQIRDLNWRLALKPFSAPFKMAIIDEAHAMTQDAQNCFLKTLEEPKGQTLLILITEHPEALLPTIVSRCQPIKFYPVKKEEIKNYLKGNSALKEEDLEEICSLASGRPGIAIDFLQNPEKLKAREFQIKKLVEISDSLLTTRFQYAKELSSKQNLKDVLDVWLSYLRKILISQQNPALTSKLKNILEFMQNINFLVTTTNVNQRLALEMIMLELPRL